MMSAQLLLATDCSDTEKLGTITSLYREMFSSEYIRKHRPQGQETVEALLAMVQICPRFAACLRMDYYDDRAIVTQTRPLDSDLLREGEVCVGVPPNLPAWMEPAHYGTIERSFRDAVARLTIKKKLATQWERGFLAGTAFLVSAGLIGGGVAIADLTERRLKLPYPTSCTSPLGVMGDPCIYSPAMRGVYIPMLVLGAALGVGGGLVIQYGHEWLYKEPK